MGGGGPSGGSTSVDMRNPKKEQGTVGNWYGFQQDQFNNFLQNQPLLNQASKGAQGFWGQLPGMLSQFGGYQNQLSQDQNQIGGFNRQLGSLYNKTGAEANQLGSWLGQVNPTIMNHGALTPQMERDVSQQTRNIASAQGSAQDTGALGTELLNRDQYQQQRFNTALQQGQGLLGQQQGVYGQQAGIAGQRAGLTSLNAGLTGQKAGLLGQQQALQTGGLNQLLGVQNAATQNFSGLTNPVLGYLGNLFGGNQQASIAQAQINEQGNQANQAKGSGIAGGAISLIGSVAAAY